MSKDKPCPANITQRVADQEEGFVLILAMVMLVVITLLGLWALNTSTTELMIAGNEQVYEQNFNTAEGGANMEMARLLSGVVSHYKPEDLDVFPYLLLPGFDADSYDPGGDMAVVIPTRGEVDPSRSQTWPMRNLGNNNDAAYNIMDFSYLVTYVGRGAPPKGYGAGDDSGLEGFQFRINSNRTTDIEIGVIKVGKRAP